MARRNGPTIARWQLARHIRAMREKAGMTQKQVGELLGCTEWKVYKFEAGDSAVGRADLIVMLDKYGVEDEDLRETLFELQQIGKQKGWWAKFGKLPTAYSNYIGMETAATEIKSYQLATIPGLLQTEEYARALIRGQGLVTNETQITKRVQLRMARQDCLNEEQPVKLWAILDEGVLRREIGGKDVMRSQLQHLMAMNKRPNITIQVLPFAEGAHPGTFGSLVLMDFPPDARSPIAYVESLAGDVYMEKEDDLQRANMVFTHLHSAALSASKSTQFIAAIAKELA